jgi:hypothetical protein
MSTMPGDLIEARLRTALVELRPADGAPATLRARVDAVPDRLADTGIVGRIRRIVAAPIVVTAPVVVVAIALAALAFRQVPPPSHLNAGGAPAPSFDPTAEGPGLLYGVIPTLIIVPGSVALLSLALALRHLRRARWIGGWRGAMRLALICLVGGGAAALALQPGFQWLGGGYGPVLGYGLQAEARPGSFDETPLWYETAPPGGPLVLAISITNPGPLPIQLDGIVEDPNAPLVSAARWVGMTVGQDQASFGEPLNHLLAFTPRTVAPGEQLIVYLAGKAGPCAFGPTFTLDNAATSEDIGGYSSKGPEITFAYSVLGLSSSAPFELPMKLVEPLRNRCP